MPLVLPTTTSLDSVDLCLAKEIRWFGLKNLDVDTILNRCKELQQENWFPPIAEPLLRTKLEHLIGLLAHLGGGESGSASDSESESETEVTLHNIHDVRAMHDSIDVKLIDAVIRLGAAKGDVEEAAELVHGLEAENWFPHVEEPLLHEKLQAISDAFGKGF
ncbi:hypothetical protein DFH06DRAFT_435529 [Mycena polygramma]|nr:hypothetical protein DFH06DRAFT_435529 [Mycena polygramma]